MSSALDATVRGALIGATLGAPLRGAIVWRRMTFYQPIPTRMAQSDSLDAWLLAARHVREGLSPERVSDVLAQRFSSATSPPVARFQLSAGLRAPIAGAFRNCDAENSEAFGRALVWGALFPGDPARARAFAWYDAASDHAGDGVSCPVASAMLLASLLGGQSIENALRIAFEALPREGRGRKLIEWVLDAKERSTSASDFHKQLPGRIGTSDPQHALLSFGWILCGLLLSDGTFDDALCTAVGCGGAADQVGAVVGALAAARLAEVPDDWRRPLGQEYVAGHALLGLEPPATIEEFVHEITASACAAPIASMMTSGATDAAPSAETTTDRSDDTPPKVHAPTEEGPQAPSAGDRSHDESTSVAVTDSQEPIQAATPAPSFPSPDVTVMVVGDIVVGIQFLDPPVAYFDRSIRMSISLTNRAQQERVIEGELLAPPGWQVATRLGSFRLRSEETIAIPAVARPPDFGRDLTIMSLTLRINDQRVSIPMFPAQEWYWVGPFQNIEGEGFDRAYRAEDVWNTREVFNGRSNLGVRWQAERFVGVLFDVEGKFANGPGVVYLYARLQFAEKERLRVVCAASTGVVVTIDRKKLLWYHDVHVPIPRPIQPYVAEFVPGEETHVLVKVLRNQQPLLPLVLYFLRPDGTLAVPTRSLPMDSD